MIGAEDNLEGGEDNKRAGSQKAQKNKKERMGDCDEVGSLQNMMMIVALQRYMTCAVEGMKVVDPIRVSQAGHRNGGDLEEWYCSLDCAE